MIGIIDYGSGNVGAISNIYKQFRIPYVISKDVSELKSADRYILPGVGAFDATMKNLRASGLVDLLEEEIFSGGKKILGICVGMQILSESSDEGELPGLGWIAGHVRKIDSSRITSNLKLPHMGWNSLEIKAKSSLLSGISPEVGFYFLHNYFFDASDENSVLATVRYGDELPCVVSRDNVMGVQFHPEKSHGNGTAIFRNFAAL